MQITLLIHFFYSCSDIIARSGLKDSGDPLQSHISCECFMDWIISQHYTKKILFHKGRFVTYLNIGWFFFFQSSVISSVLNCLRKSTLFMLLPSFLNQIELMLRDFHYDNGKSLLFSLVLGRWRLGSRLYFHFAILLQSNNNNKAIII